MPAYECSPPTFSDVYTITMKSSGSAKCSAFVFLPTLSQTITTQVNLSERFSDLAGRLLSLAGLPDSHPSLHVYGLDGDFKMFPDSQCCSVLLMNTYRRLVLLPAAARRVTVYFESLSSEIDVPDRFLVGDLIQAATDCFYLELMKMRYIVVDPKRMVVCPVDTMVSETFYVLKRANFYSSEMVFSGQAAIDEAVAACPIFLVSKFLVAPPMKALLSLIRGRHDSGFELVPIKEDRLRTIMTGYAKSQDLSKTTSLSDQNNLLFLLFGSNDLPLLSPRLHAILLDAMAEESDVVKFQKICALILWLPFETHVMLSEMGLTFGGALASEKARATVVRLIGELLFSERIDRVAEDAFVAFVLVCSQWLFGYPPKKGRQLRRAGTQLVLVDGATVITCDGKACKLAISATEPFEASRDFAQYLTKAQAPQEGKLPQLREFTELNERVAAARGTVGEHTREKVEDAFTVFDFDSLFV
jgi:hypothetical protein